MDLIRIYQLLVFLLLTLYVITEEDEPETPACTLVPIDLEVVNILVYINGGTKRDIDWWIQHCYYYEKGMPWDSISPVTIKVGANVVCDENSGACVCPNAENAAADCTTTFEHACIAKILGQEKYQIFLCCTVVCMDPATRETKGFKACVAEFELEKLLEACMQNTGSVSPKEIALKHAKEVIDNGVDVTKQSEPYFFMEGIFTECVNEYTWQYWLLTICTILKVDVSNTIELCVTELAL